MARPIKETPILTGEDAERFVRDLEEVEARSKEEREASRKEFQERVKEAKKLITFCLQSMRVVVLMPKYEKIYLCEIK